MLKLTTRFLRPIGMLFIFTFAVICIFGSIFVRDLDPSTWLGTLIDYTVSFENRFYDYRMKAHLSPEFKSQDIALVKIDDYSLQKIGSWPIPRTEYAHLLRKISQFGGKVVALDVMFPERSPQHGKESPDSVFAQSIREFQTSDRRVFLAYTLANFGEEALKEAPLEMLNDAIITRNTDKDLQPQQIARYTFPISELVATEVGLGSISSQEDSDGIFRRYQLISNVDTIYYGSLGFNAYEAFIGKKNTVHIFSDGTAELEINGKKMEIGRSGETKIRYIGGEEQFPSASLYDVLSAPDDSEAMRKILSNKIVFVGSTALGAHDLRPSPIDPKMPGVLSHLNMAHMLLHQYFFKNSNDSVQYSLILLFVGMLLFVLVQRLGHASLDAAFVMALIAGSYLWDKIYFLPEGYELKLFYCYFCFVASYSWSTFVLFQQANKEKKQIRGTFARYVAPTIVDEMLKDPEKLIVGGTKMDITCLFSDVRDFTSISEGLTPTELAHSLNLYMGKMTDIVFDTRGTLDKYIGDAIVAFWGAPLPVGNHAQHAVEGAIRMLELLPSINEEFEKLGRPKFKVGVGLNSGECSVGNMGSDRIFSYTALGDSMNLGARLEGLCKYYGADILISEYTLSRISGIRTRPIDRVIVKGKTTPVGVFEALHAHHAFYKDQWALENYLRAHELFINKRFEEAHSLFSEIYSRHSQDRATQRFFELTKSLLEGPVPEDFSVTRMTDK